MVRSARTACSVTTLGALLAGCATTQQEAARLRVNSARDRASALTVRVNGTNPSVAVQAVKLISGSHGSAVVVRLRNRLAHPISDLPISVGVLGRSGHRRYLNGTAGADYFLTHIPAIGPGGVLDWVFTTSRPLARGARPFAAVGPKPPPEVVAPRSLPRIAVTASALAAGAGQRVRLTVRNLSSVPQYQLQVYAVACAQAGTSRPGGPRSLTSEPARAPS